MAGPLDPEAPFVSSAATDTALLQRLSNVLHDMGLPCSCQEEVERTVAVFAEFEVRRARRRLLESARSRARQLAGFLPYLDDLNAPEAAVMDPEDLTALADAFRQIANAASQGVASLELLASLNETQCPAEGSS
ncbi:hypothetical protein [Pannonibacter carbonis]|uniref:hypothetical protein n=1 Tax=Pannonibacter carbonis TaxID=2067569 RepID=UPI000D0E9111|nr:hypothetical protein [Pannonibacter carbonis]